MTVLVTGAAGFIGFHVCRALLARGDLVLGVDDLNGYYDIRLKEARLAHLDAHDGFTFAPADIADRQALSAAIGSAGAARIGRIVHLAAQPGVRHSLVDPWPYMHTNVMGQLAMLEICRSLPALDHFVYASSSSVYAGTGASTDTPISLYAATKKAGELISHSYGHLFSVPATGLRLFSVYGPWGRPDMAAFLFTRAILEDQPITLFNNGHMKRDFTCIADVAPAILSVLDAPPAPAEGVPHRIYDIGLGRSEALSDFVAVLEQAIGRPAVIRYAPLQPGDPEETRADITALRRDHGFQPETTIAEGLPRFVAWYRRHYGV